MGAWSERFDDELIVYNRDGYLFLNPQGVVTRLYIDDGVEDFTGHFNKITRVDLDEWRKHWKKEPLIELDISDVAYWFRNSDKEEEIYQPADELASGVGELFSVVA